MSAVSDFFATQMAYNDRQGVAISRIMEDVNAQNAVITALNARIVELLASSGQISADDQAMLNDLQQRGESISTALEALDALTPPAPPVVP
jgi:uncharacterized FlgJ-related protein